MLIRGSRMTTMSIPLTVPVHRTAQFAVEHHQLVRPISVHMCCTQQCGGAARILRGSKARMAAMELIQLHPRVPCGMQRFISQLNICKYILRRILPDSIAEAAFAQICLSHRVREFLAEKTVCKRNAAAWK